MTQTVKFKQKRRCPHCYAASPHVACTTCNRDMCEDCISYGLVGKVCGLCKDREEEDLCDDPAERGRS